MAEFAMWYAIGALGWQFYAGLRGLRFGEVGDWAARALWPLPAANYLGHVVRTVMLWPFR